MMNTEKTLDQMMELLPFITPILDDPALKDMRPDLRPNPDEGKSGFSMSELIARIYPLMLTSHRAELYGILGVLTGKTTEDVKLLPFAEIKKILKEENVLKDFFDFFPFLLQMALRA